MPMNVSLEVSREFWELGCVVDPADLLNHPLDLANGGAGGSSLLEPGRAARTLGIYVLFDKASTDTPLQPRRLAPSLRAQRGECGSEVGLKFAYNWLFSRLT